MVSPIGKISTNKTNCANNSNNLHTKNKVPTIKFFDFRSNSIDKFTSFSLKSLVLMCNLPHKTNLLNIAQAYVGNIIEVTNDELAQMTPEQKRHTQAEIIGNNGVPEYQWCAYTVSYLCKEANIDIGNTKGRVQDFINWGTKNGTYKPIKTTPLTESNYTKERANRAKQIKAQTRNMKEGDLIIWKSDTMFKTQLGLKGGNSSHIGIIEKINPDGSVVVIEGNANEVKSDSQYERYVVTNESEGKVGNQEIGEFQEINLRDGIIRKIYTAEELAANGYSGYINMQKIIK